MLKLPGYFPTDEEFLTFDFSSAARPLENSTPPRRILFSPGYGVGLGDQFMCVPALKAVATRFPAAALTVLTNYPEFWGCLSGVHCAVIPRAPEDVLSLLDHVSQGYDLVIAGYHPNCLSALAKSKAPTVFCAGRDLNSFRCFLSRDGEVKEVPLDMCKRALAEADKFYALFADAGLVAPKHRRLEAFERGAPFSTALCSRKGNSSPARMLLHPYSAEHEKEWQIDKWAAVINLLTVQDMRVDVSAGTSERELRLGRSLVASASGARLLQQMPLKPFMELLAHYDLVISGDTFITHAVAHQQRGLSLAVFGPTDSMRYCPPGPHNHFLCASVRPEDVVYTIQLLLEARSGVDSLNGFLSAEAGGLLHGLLRCVSEFYLSTDSLRARSLILEAVAKLRAGLPRQSLPLIIGTDALFERLGGVVSRADKETAQEFLDQWGAVRLAKLASGWRE